MPTVEYVQRLFERYTQAWTRGDIETVLSLFAPDAVVHDPVDGPALRGTSAIRDFFTVAPIRVMSLSGPVHISADGLHAAARVDVELNLDDGIKVVEAMDVWTFDRDGRISTMNAYWGPSNFRDR